MCDHDKKSVKTDNLSAALAEAFPAAHRVMHVAEDIVRGSRRYRLWELPGNTHCPLIGVCLPMPVLRKIAARMLVNKPHADDYDVHVAAVAQCAHRVPMSEAFQRELDKRYAMAIRRFAQAKTTAALAGMWDQALQGADVAGALWATFSHPRCDETLRDKVCQDIHMFQHQVGAFNRADVQRLAELKDENAVLTRELSAQQERNARDMAQRIAEVDLLNAELMRLRGQLLGRDSALAAAREEFTALQEAVPGLETRVALANRLEAQQRRIQDIERERASWELRALQEANRAQQLEKDAAGVRIRLENLEMNIRSTSRDSDAMNQAVRDKAVLCVGGRPASVPSYRQMIECSGGKFLHHDGGEENNPAQLDACLAAADLVICQTGCVSHDAYWRVKDHCKRTGKRCVFVEKPSASSLARCLHGLGEGGDGKLESVESKSES